MKGKVVEGFVKKLLFVGFGLLLILALFSCKKTEAGVDPSDDFVMDEPMPSGGENAKKIELTFTRDAISPSSVTMKAGEKVLFVIKNVDSQEDHNLLEPDAGLKEILVHPGQTVRRLWTAPDKAGAYEPTCAIHPWIRMTITVQ